MKVAVIGGTGFYQLPELSNVQVRDVASKYAARPVVCTVGDLGKQACVFLPRHGQAHTVPPHRINYRANIDALSTLGVSHIIAINAVGGISDYAFPGAVVLPDQVVDYTWGREHTFFDDFDSDMQHIDFSKPLECDFRSALFDALRGNLPCRDGGTYACVQGPRLESAAEIVRLGKDGCDVVGMTLMPEAALARERKMQYLSVCVVANWAAGITEQVSLAAIKQVLADTLTNVRTGLVNTLVNL